MQTTSVAVAAPAATTTKSPFWVCKSEIDRVSLVSARVHEECRMEMITNEKQKQKKKKKIEYVRSRKWWMGTQTLFFFRFCSVCCLLMTHNHNTYNELIILLHSRAPQLHTQRTRAGTHTHTNVKWHWFSSIMHYYFNNFFFSSFCVLLCHDHDVKRTHLWESIAKNSQLEQKHKGIGIWSN